MPDKELTYTILIRTSLLTYIETPPRPSRPPQVPDKASLTDVQKGQKLDAALAACLDAAPSAELADGCSGGVYQGHTWCTAIPCTFRSVHC